MEKALQIITLKLLLLLKTITYSLNLGYQINYINYGPWYLFFISINAQSKIAHNNSLYFMKKTNF